MVKQWFSKLNQKLLTHPLGTTLFFNMTKSIFVPSSMTNAPRLPQLYSELTQQSIKNNQTMPNQFHRLWPHWVYKQYHPTSHTYMGISHPLFSTNIGYRNWTLLSRPNSNALAIIDPTGLITPFNKGWSTEYWLKTKKDFFLPATQTDITQKTEEKTPKVITTLATKTLAIEQETFVHNTAEGDVLFNQISVINKGKSPLNGALYVAIKPYNPEGVCEIASLQVLSNNVLLINHKHTIHFDQTPQNIVCTTFEESLFFEKGAKWEHIHATHCPNKQASAYLGYVIELAPNETTHISYKIPLNLQTKKNLFTTKQTYLNALSQKNNDILNLNYEREDARFSQYWKTLQKNLTQIESSDPALQRLFTQSQHHLLSFLGKSTISSGAAIYNKSWIKESTHISLALNRIGGSALIKPYLKAMIKRSNAFFNNTNESDQFGQLIVLIYDIYCLTKDKVFLNTQYKAVQTLVKQMKKRQFKKNKHHPELNGLLKDMPTHHPDKTSEYYIWNNLWNLAGFEKAGKIAQILGKGKEAHILQGTASQLNAKLVRFLNRCLDTYKSTEPTAFPPKKLLDSSIILSLGAIYPLDLLPTKSGPIKSILTLIEQQFLINNTYFNFGQNQGFNIIYNFLLAQTYLKSQDPKLFPLIDWLEQQGPGTGAFPEAIHPITKQGCGGDGHYAWPSAEYSQLVRNMMVSDSDNILHIFPFIHPKWLDNKDAYIELTNCPTLFGPLTICIQKEDHTFSVTFSITCHTPPKNIRLSMPFNIASVKWKDQHKKVNSNTVSLPCQKGTLSLIPSTEDPVPE